MKLTYARGPYKITISSASLAKYRTWGLLTQKTTQLESGLDKKLCLDLILTVITVFV